MLSEVAKADRFLGSLCQSSSPTWISQRSGAGYQKPFFVRLNCYPDFLPFHFITSHSLN